MAAVVLTAVILAWRGWPWWAWLPAALLAGACVALAAVLAGYLYYKMHHARIILEHRQPPVTTRHDGGEGEG